MNVVSYALFRNEHSWSESEKCGEARGRVFINYVRLIMRAHHAIWKPFQLRFAVDDRAQEFPYFRAMEAMERAGLLKLVRFGKSISLCGIGGMLERLRPAWERGVEYVVCRDVDSVPLPRDRRAVEEFIALGVSKSANVIHDASAHSGAMGGTLSVHGPRFRALIACDSLEEFVQRGKQIDFNQHGADQHLLNKHWPLYAEQTLLHELHHDVGDLPRCKIVRSVDGPMPDDILPAVGLYGDGFSKIIGGCADVEAPFRFYDSLDLEAIRTIQRCEKESL